MRLEVEITKSQIQWSTPKSVPSDAVATNGSKAVGAGVDSPGRFLRTGGRDNPTDAS
jgi:hypothetical protein